MHPAPGFSFPPLQRVSDSPCSIAGNVTVAPSGLRMSRNAMLLLFAVIAVGAGILTALLLPRTEAPAMAPRPAAAAPVPPTKASRSPGNPLSSTRSQPSVLAPESRAALLQEIEDMAVQYDARMLPQLEPLLSHSDAEVRAAAAQGIVTLGETAGAALLRRAALSAPTPEEAVRLKSQADYLELPPAAPEDSAR